jgi:hypothetical protein
LAEAFLKKRTPGITKDEISSKLSDTGTLLTKIMRGICGLYKDGKDICALKNADEDPSTAGNFDKLKIAFKGIG